MKVVYFPAGKDACAIYRMLLPHIHTPNSTYVMSAEFKDSQVADRQVAVIQRLSNRANWNAIKKIKSAGVKVVYDLDDNLWDIPLTNPAFKVVTVDQKGFEACMALSDFVITSTPPLRKAVVENSKIKVPIEVVPNALDFDWLKPLPDRPLREEGVILGWGGSGSHTGDVEAVFDIMGDIVKEDERVSLEVIGMELSDELKALKRVRERYYVPVEEYFSRFPCWMWDIIVAPLAAIKFNSSKSNIKMLEAAALRVPILVSNVVPYRDFCSLHPDLRYLVCKKASDWKKKLKELIEEPERRKFYGDLLHQVAREHYDIAKVNQERLTIFESL